jgi:multidrug transporter EmrE-like cation transporter
MVAQARLTAFLILLGAICLTVTGELFLKTGMTRVGTVGIGGLLQSAGRAIGTPQIWAGFFFVFSGALVWLVVLSRMPLSWAYPMLSLGYILVLFLSKVVLGEHVSPIRWFGTLIVIAGVWLVYRS